MHQEITGNTQLLQTEIILYIYLLNNLDMISCQICYCIPHGENKMYRIKNSRLCYCEKCINKWVNNYNNPITGIKLRNKDVEVNYEINDLIQIYLKYKKLNIKNIKIDISMDKNEDENIFVY
jgi:hypothetical protein